MFKENEALLFEVTQALRRGVPDTLTCICVVHFTDSRIIHKCFGDENEFFISKLT